MLEALKIALICMIENLERQTLLFSSSVPYYILSDIIVRPLCEASQFGFPNLPFGEDQSPKLLVLQKEGI